MTNKQRIKALEEYIATFNNDYDRMFFCFMPCMLSLPLEQIIEELKKFRLFDACVDCGGAYTIIPYYGVSPFKKPSWGLVRDVKIDIYNQWKKEIAKRAIELLAE